MTTSVHVHMKRWRSLGSSFLVALGMLFASGLSAQSLPYNFDFTTDPFANGWSQQSVSGAQAWAYNATFSNASMSAFSGGCQVNEDWLISPVFDLTASSAELLSVDIQRGFSGDNGVEVLYSSNYSGTGDPNAATWTSIIDVTSQFFTDNSIPNNTSETFGPFNDLQSANAAAVYVAFKFDYQIGGCSTWRIAGLELVSANAPSIAPSAEDISNLNYDEGAGPSAGTSFTVSGSNMTGSGNVAMTAPAGFEISLNDVFYGNALNLPFASGIITAQPRTVFVRLVAGQPAGVYNGDLTISGGGADASISLSGIVAIPGTFIVDFEGAGETKASYASGDVSLSGLLWNMTNALIGTDASDFKNGTRSARMRGYGDSEFALLENKTGGIGNISFVYARYGSDTQTPYVLEYSTDNGTIWIQIGDEFTATESPVSFFATVNEAADARVRFRTVETTGTSNRRMNIDDIAITDFGVANAQIFATPASVGNLNYGIGEGPSAGGSYTLSASNLNPGNGNISVAAPANFEISTDSATWSGSIDVAYSDNGATIATEKIYVRLAAGLGVGSYSGDISHTGGDAAADVSVAGSVSASTLPALFSLSSGDYTLNEWDSENESGSYPANMRFQWSNDPSAESFNSNADGTGVYNCGYNLVSRPRINGNGAEGFSFVTTGSAQYNDCTSGAADNDRFLGSAVIGLNTSGVSYARIAWLNRLIVEAPRNFAVRLQYRIGDAGDYLDFASAPGYNSIGKLTGDTATTNFILPAEVLGQSEVYLRLNYFQLGVGSGNRPEMGVDNILITTEELVSPLLSLSETAVTGLYYSQGDGPSAASSYTLTGSNLAPVSGLVTVEAPANFEISLDGSIYSGTLNIGYNGGNLSEEISVRLIAGLAVGTYTGTSINHTGGSASSVSVSISGDVGYPVNLGVGDVSIIGFRSVENDGVAFSTWVDLPAGTVILFTDNAYTGSTLNTNENLAVWENTTGEIITAGTVVKIGGPELGNGLGASLGTLVEGSLNGFAQGGDNIFAFQGALGQPSWVYGLSYPGTWLTEGSVSNSTSFLPTALNVPSGNIVISERNAQYSAGRTGEASYEAYKSFVSVALNWTLGFDGVLFGDFNTEPFELGTATCAAEGGTLVAPANRSFCVGTGTPVAINITAVGASGTNKRWGLIDAAGNVLETRSVNSQFNLDTKPPGDYSIRYIQFENDVTNIGDITNISQVNTLVGCFDFASNAITVFLRNEPTAGTLTALSPTTVCANGGPQTGIQVGLDGFDGENRRYGVVSQALGNQVVLQAAGTPTGATFNLNGLEPGTYRVFALASQAGVNLANVEFSSDLEGCFDLSNAVTVVIEDCAGLALTSSPNPADATSFVTFSSEVAVDATLEVFDMGGRMVEQLFNQYLAPGQEYRIEFNSAALPNGVYMYRLTTENEVIVEKFMIAH